MADEGLTPEQYRAQIKAMTDQTAVMTQLVRAIDPHAPSGTGSSPSGARRREAKRDSDTGLGGVHKSLKKAESGIISGFGLLSGETHKLMGAFEGLAGAFVGFEIIKSTINYIGDLNKNYRELSAVGQTFHGSLFDMAEAAGNAGLPLDQFGALITKNSKVLATTGMDQTKFLAINKNVRDSLMRYGYSIEDVTDLQTTYMEIQRTQGHISTATTEQASANLVDFGKHVQGLADAFGVSRDEILKNTAESMENASILVKSLGLSGEAAAQWTDKATNAMAIFGAIPGQLGKELSSGVADAMGGFGTSLYSGAFKDFNSVGLPIMRSIMDDMAKKLNAIPVKDVQAQIGVVAEGLFQTGQEIQKNRGMLMIQAEGGNEQARQVLQEGAQILSMGGSEAEIKKHMLDAQKQADAMTVLTQAFLGFTNFLTEIGGSLVAGLMEPLKALDKFVDGKTIDNFEDQLKTAAANIGRAIGGWLTGVITFLEAHPTYFTDLFTGISQALGGFVIWFNTIHWDQVFKTVVDVMTDFAAGVLAILKFFHWITPQTQKDLAAMATTAAGSANKAQSMQDAFTRKLNADIALPKTPINAQRIKVDQDLLRKAIDANTAAQTNKDRSAQLATAAGVAPGTTPGGPAAAAGPAGPAQPSAMDRWGNAFKTWADSVGAMSHVAGTLGNLIVPGHSLQQNLNNSGKSIKAGLNDFGDMFGNIWKEFLLEAKMPIVDAGKPEPTGAGSAHPRLALINPVMSLIADLFPSNTKAIQANTATTISVHKAAQKVADKAAFKAPIPAPSTLALVKHAAATAKSQLTLVDVMTGMADNIAKMLGLQTAKPDDKNMFGLTPQQMTNFLAGRKPDDNGGIGTAITNVVQAAGEAMTGGLGSTVGSIVGGHAAVSAATFMKSDLANHIKSFFLGKGASSTSTQGILGGMFAEGVGGKGVALGRSGKYGALGIGQWLGPRKAALIARYGQNPTVDQQLQFMWDEMHGPAGRKVDEHRAGQLILNAKTGREASGHYVVDYMRPGDGTAGDLSRAATYHATLEQSTAAPITAASPAVPKADVTRTQYTDQIASLEARVAADIEKEKDYIKRHHGVDATKAKAAEEIQEAQLAHLQELIAHAKTTNRHLAQLPKAGGTVKTRQA